MAILRYPSKQFRQVATPVSVFDATLVQDVAKVLAEIQKNKVWGLTAPQIGLKARFFALEPSLCDVHCFVNPQIVEKEGEALFQQDCISFPGVMIHTPRAKTIKLEYQDEHGKKHEASFDGEVAYRIQHQIDLLDGITFIDYLSKLKRDRLLKKYDKVLKNPHACHDTACGHDHSHDHEHHHD